MKKGDLFPVHEGRSIESYSPHMVQYTGEKRCPKKGEWYLSGAIVGGFKAPNDLSTVYHIGKLVNVKHEHTHTITVLGEVVKK